MPYLQPTVRQLEPFGRRHQSVPVVPQEAVAPTRAAVAESPTAKAHAPRRRSWRPRLSARATLSS
jgi:hypothetical protein